LLLFFKKEALAFLLFGSLNMDLHAPQTDSVYGEDLEMFRATLRSFYRKVVEPNVKSYEAEGVG